MTTAARLPSPTDAPWDPSATELEAEVMRVVYRSDPPDFAIVLAVTDAGEEVALAGALADVHPGETLRVRGAFRRHPRHGYRFQVSHVELRPPSSEQALFGYLSSIKHVGTTGAIFLLDRYGIDVLEVIDRSPRARLLEVPGIGRARISGAVASWEEQSALRAVRLFLSEHGVEAAVASRITRALGSDSVELLREDPYRITELDGIGFLTADALARSLGLAGDDPRRLDAGLLYVLAQAELDGHCHLPRPELAERARALLGADPQERIDGLAASGRLRLAPPPDGSSAAEIVLDPDMDGVEHELAEEVRRLLEAPPVLELRRLRRPERGPFVPTDAQWHGITQVLSCRLAILTGLPGTGKSATMRVLVDLLRRERRRVRLCAPTGKAARRLSAACGVEATTIHRLLEWSPGEGFTRGPEHPIDDADVLIVDEASMLGVRLAGALLRAVGPHTHVLLVGDIDQLAPVGPGRVLEDLIACGRVPVTALSEIFRQAARSLIVRAAHAINRGERPPLTADGPDDLRDFFFIARNDPAAAFHEIVSLAAERLPSHYDLQPAVGVQVLAPMHRGPLGIDALNTELRARLNPDGPAVTGTPLRVGDRVIQTRNDYEHELMNGELGVIVEGAGPGGRTALVLATDDGRRLALPGGAIDTLRLAYAVSVHKAQGSQAPAIVVPLVKAHRIMLTRNLLYTAVTRAERVCVLVGEPAALELALSRRDARRRHTRLAELVAA
ncbi:MAG TPA: ATP-dependent RecD-like DNA helicase [Solirubrobacteraceae bacterium]|nr:ATP-dependent RecD-like DNA helicase [Solirubrobacteraceae bacterium]